MMEYPKIHSLYKRQGWYFDEQCKKDPTKQQGRQSFIVGDYACEEFGNIKHWDVEEKIDGTNIRVFYKDGQVRFGGRTKDAQIPCHLLDYLQEWFTPSLLSSRFADKAGIGTQVILFGEGFGPKIGKGGGLYSKTTGFCLFDVFVGGWWLEKNVVREVLSEQFGCLSPSCLMKKATEEEIIEYVKQKNPSIFAMNDPKHQLIMEGVICRPTKMMMFRDRPVISEDPIVHADYHIPIMYKLKTKEF
jgi:hypothetical protein